MFYKLIRLSLFSSCLVLGAEDRPYRFGAEIFWSQPTASLRKAFSSSVGNGAGLYLDVDLGSGKGLRWDLGSLVLFPDKVLPGTPDPSQPKAHLLSTTSMLSYSWHVRGGRTGPYLLAGLGSRQFLGQADIAGAPTSQGGAMPGQMRYAVDSGLKLAYQVGFGYDFGKHWGATVRCVGSRSQGKTLATIEGGVNYQF